MTNFNDIPFVKQQKEKFSNEMIDKTKHYQQQYGFEIGSGNHATWNNEADAFKHAFMQADLARKFGGGIAKFLGDNHENSGKDRGQPTGEENMDRWNNQQGREVAKEIKEEYIQNMPKTDLFRPRPEVNFQDATAKKVMERMNEGKLITNPNDKRQYKEKKPWFANKWFATGQAAPVSNNEDFDDSKGHWVTMNGAHVFIKD